MRIAVKRKSGIRIKLLDINTSKEGAIYKICFFILPYDVRVYAVWIAVIRAPGIHHHTSVFKGSQRIFGTGKPDS